jgi:hypothetical protein
MGNGVKACPKESVKTLISQFRFDKEIKRTENLVLGVIG